MKKHSVETVKIEGRTYINVIGLAESLREVSSLETNKDVKGYIIHLVNELTNILTKQ